MADNTSFTSHEEEDLNASWGRDIDWGMQGRLQLSNPDRKNGEYFASFRSSYSSLSAALSPNGAHASAFDACAAPQPDVTSSPNGTMALSDSNHFPTPSTARSPSFPHPLSWGVAAAPSPSVPDDDRQQTDPLALVLVRTSSSTPGFRLSSSNLPIDILSIPEPTNIPSAGSYADPYAGVILAASCPTGCPLCSSSNAPRSEYVDGSVTKAHINTPFSHPEPPEEPSPRLPSFSSVSGDTAALPSSFRDTPGLHDDSNVWRTTDEKECGDTPDVPYLWPSSPSPSSSTTFAQGELSSAVTSARQRTPTAASPNLAIVQPIPRYGSFSRSNDHNDDHDSNVAQPPLLCSYFPSPDASLPHPAFDNGNGPHNTSASTDAHTSLQSESIPRDWYTVSPSPKTARRRLARGLARCCATRTISPVPPRAFAASTSVRPVSKARLCRCVVAHRLVPELSRAQLHLAAVEHMLALDCCSGLLRCAPSHAWQHLCSRYSDTGGILAGARYSRRLGVLAQ